MKAVERTWSMTATGPASRRAARWARLVTAGATRAAGGRPTTSIARHSATTMVTASFLSKSPTGGPGAWSSMRTSDILVSDAIHRPFRG